MKSILRNNAGIALGVVLAIMGVVSVLAAGMFYFSYNELNFARLDVNRARADYLARAGVEIASKSFGGVAGHFSDLTDPVTMGPLYLHPEGDEDDNVISTVQADSAGSVTVRVFEDERVIVEGGAAPTEQDKYTVWAYAADARVGISRATARGFSLPVAYVGDPDDPAVGVRQLDWIQKSGGSCTMQTPPYRETRPVSAINGPSSIPVYYYDPYRGVAVMPEANGRLSMPTASASGHKAFGWYASAICFEAPIDLRRAQVINVLILGAPTIVFEKEIHIYTDNYQPRMGNIILTTNQTSRVYFKENVYLHAGSTQIKVFDGGTAWQFGDEASGRKDIDILQYAVDTGLVSSGLSGALRDLFATRQGTKYTAADLAELANPAAPTVNSLIEVVWD